MQDIHYWFWIASLYTISLSRRRELLNRFGSPKALFHEAHIPWECFLDISRDDIKTFEESRDIDRIQKAYEQLEKDQITFVPIVDERYSELLKQIYDPPLGLFCIGDCSLLNRYSVAVIGSRQCSPYGANCAESITSYLSMRGIVIVSGMAAGVDSRAHQSALKNGGDTIAVLAGGCNVCYPRQNIGLYEAIKTSGLIISEMPPDTTPLAMYFPIRNRIISGLSQSVLVVEARTKSGTKITADCALDQGRDVYAVPGRIYDALSEGCNQLILEGATPLLTPEQMLKSQNISPPFLSNNSQIPKKGLEKDEILLYSCVDCEPVHIDELARRSGINRSDLSLILTRLEWDGFIEQPVKNYYMKHIEFAPGKK